MTNEDALAQFFDKFFADLEADAQSKGQKIPTYSFRHTETNEGGQAFAAEHLKYLVYGRGPGKMPPPEKIEEWVKQNLPNVPFKSVAYAIGLKITKEGTDIYQGKKPGVDFLGSMEKNMPELLKTIARNEVMNIATSLKQAIR